MERREERLKERGIKRKAREKVEKRERLLVERKEKRLRRNEEWVKERYGGPRKVEEVKEV